MRISSKKIDWGPEIKQQFIRQASWTRAYRNQLYRQIGLIKAKNLLEVGCGTGVITKELREKTSAKITAIDFDKSMIDIAKDYVSDVRFLTENVEKLTFKDKSFDFVISHYFLLWISNPEKALSEIVRVCKQGAIIVALAEPDYGAWIEYPELELGKYHIEYLQKEGADPYIGRKILALFESAGLETELSVVAQTWNQNLLQENIVEEWKRVLEADLITENEFNEIIKNEITLIKKNQRMIFIPIFTAVGKKK
ncbi:MAG: class I SAM-dependent methyltransferase [Candidatus Thorarchaeota archaeon]